ncbi:MAG TPA: Rap1a/Tai family immunity protein [Allosphingosinicella sp.]
MKALFTALSAMMLTAAQSPTTSPRATAPQTARPAPQAAQSAPQAVRIPTRVTARILVGLCGSDRGACLTYVLGAADAWSGALLAAGRPQVFCFPAGTTNDAIAQSTVQYLRARPQQGGDNGAVALLAALTAIYPCPR